MRCPQCNSKLSKKAAFCSICGAAAPERTPKRFPVKLILCVVFAVSVLLNVLSFMRPATRLEGRGFRSPEAAITAYAKALRKGDVQEMLSTFAIESLDETYDLEQQIDQYGFFNYTQGNALLPNDSAYHTQINHYARLSSIAQQIFRGYYALAGIDTDSEVITFKTRQDPDAPSKFYKQLKFPDLDEKLSQIKLGKVLTAEDFGRNDDIYASVLESQDFWGVSEFCEVAIEVEFDGKDYLLFMLTGKIGSRWYNLSTYGQLYLLQSNDGSLSGVILQ